MNRRDLLFLAGGLMTAPRALRAQQKVMPVIGFLSPASPGPYAPFVAAVRQGLSETGYVEGQNWRSNTAGERATMVGCPPWAAKRRPDSRRSR
jgi:hypothetical protein